jgi:aspartyl-tRNA(Asn)/glutamyl-tRNA(Gln) amidotransferase subunit A
MAEAIRRKRVSPIELTQTLLAAIAEQDPVLNAFITIDEESALSQARRAEAAVMMGEELRPLHGVPVSIKDSFAVQGVRTTFGSKIFADSVAQEDAPLVERLKLAGAVILGKTTMSEFAWKAVTDSPLTGITRNPWNPAYSPGGSSGGAAAHVAAGLGPLAIGTDGGGSIRIPAAFTGIYGLKPSFGRVPGYPSSAFDALSHPGPLTRTVADAALLLSIIAGPHPADRLSLEAPPADYCGKLAEGAGGLRIAWSPDFGFARVDPEVIAVTTAAAHVFSELGAHVEEITPEFGDSTELYRVFLRVGAAASIADYLPQREGELDPGLVQVARAGMVLSALDFARAQRERHRFYDRVRRFFERYDLLLSPTVPILPLPAGHNAPDPNSLGEDWIDWSPFSFPFNLTQMPAASVPAGWSRAGLPIGLQIVGPPFADLTVLQASAAFEVARPWAHRWPPVARASGGGGRCKSGDS